MLNPTNWLRERQTLMSSIYCAICFLAAVPLMQNGAISVIDWAFALFSQSQLDAVPQPEGHSFTQVKLPLAMAVVIGLAILAMAPVVRIWSFAILSVPALAFLYFDNPVSGYFYVLFAIGLLAAMAYRGSLSTNPFAFVIGLLLIEAVLPIFGFYPRLFSIFFQNYVINPINVLTMISIWFFYVCYLNFGTKILKLYRIFK